MNWKEQATLVASDRLSGASILAQNSAKLLLAYARQCSSPDLESLEADVTEIIHTVLLGQPSMASVVCVLNDAALALQEAPTVEAALAGLCLACERHLTSASEEARQLVVESLSILPSKGTVLTLSSSVAVLNSLLAARQNGYNLRVICLESRPNFEGQVLAQHLSEGGLDVVLVIDAAAYTFLQETDLFVTGADSLTENGVINKIGTAGVASMARALGVIGYALCETKKIWPSKLDLPAILEQVPEEVWPRPATGVKVRNLYFDVTPWKYLAGAVTELGILSGSKVAQYGRRIEVSPIVASTLAGGEVCSGKPVSRSDSPPSKESSF